MKKGICGLLVAAMVLVLGSMVMAGTETITFNSAYDARVYHESIGPSTTVGGWKLGVGFRYSTSNPDEMSAWHDDVANREVKFVNKLSGDTFITNPHYCYNTPPDANCDATVWFGNRLNVSDGMFTDSPIAAWDVYLDGEDAPVTTMILPPDNAINLFSYPEILGGKNGMINDGTNVKITYTSSVLSGANLKIIIYDKNYNNAFVQSAMIQGGKLIIYVPANSPIDNSSLSGCTGRLQMSYSSPTTGTITKSTFFKLP